MAKRECLDRTIDPEIFGGKPSYPRAEATGFHGLFR